MSSPRFPRNLKICSKSSIKGLLAALELLVINNEDIIKARHMINLYGLLT